MDLIDLMGKVKEVTEREVLKLVELSSNSEEPLQKNEVQVLEILNKIILAHKEALGDGTIDEELRKVSTDDLLGDFD